MVSTTTTVPRHARTAIGAVLLLLLARYVLLAAACAPFGDDWGYAAMGMRSEPWARLLHEHRTWNGRYFSNALVLYGPLTLGLGPGLTLYRLMPVLLLFLSTAAGAWVLGARPAFDLPRGDRWMLALGFTLLQLHLMPHLGEGLYWYTGAVTYQGAWVLMLLHAGALLRAEAAGLGWRWGPVAGLTLVAAAGCNETAMVLLVLGHAVPVLGALRQGRRPAPMPVALLALAVGCGLVVALAPGNAVRSMHFPQRHDLWLTLGMGGAQALRFAASWLVDPVLPAVLLLAWQAGRSEVHRRFPCVFVRGPVRWSAAAALALAAGTLLPYWAMGMLGQHRTLNLVLAPFLLAAVATAMAWGRSLHLRRVPAWSTARGVRRLALGVALAGLVGWGNDLHVTRDLLSGDAWRFRRHTASLHSGIARAVRNGEALAEVPVFPAPLRSLRIPEPTADPEAYWNRTLAGYFGGDAFRVVAAPAPTASRPPGER
ncbi:MAG: hypothetical protein GFGODING_01923 [Flavobacteriales bacterium]|nr:hypothetical protein [Flavobacteriales bacterium]